jgi:hypothetical protein
MFFSCSRADERNCGLGGKTRAKLWEYVCLKRRKEDFREAMRLKGLGWLMKGTPLLFSNRSRIYHSISIFATQPLR